MMRTVWISFAVAVPNAKMAAMKYGCLGQSLHLNNGVQTHDKDEPFPTVKLTQRPPNQRSKTESKNKQTRRCSGCLSVDIELSRNRFNGGSENGRGQSNPASRETIRDCGDELLAERPVHWVVRIIWTVEGYEMVSVLIIDRRFLVFSVRSHFGCNGNLIAHVHD